MCPRDGGLSCASRARPRRPRPRPQPLGLGSPRSRTWMEPTVRSPAVGGASAGGGWCRKSLPLLQRARRTPRARRTRPYPPFPCLPSVPAWSSAPWTWRGCASAAPTAWPSTWRGTSCSAAQPPEIRRLPTLSTSSTSSIRSSVRDRAPCRHDGGGGASAGAPRTPRRPTGPGSPELPRSYLDPFVCESPWLPSGRGIWSPVSHVGTETRLAAGTSVVSLKGRVARLVGRSETGPVSGAG